MTEKLQQAILIKEKVGLREIHGLRPSVSESSSPSWKPRQKKRRNALAGTNGRSASWRIRTPQRSPACRKKSGRKAPKSRICSQTYSASPTTTTALETMNIDLKGCRAFAAPCTTVVVHIFFYFDTDTNM